MALRDRIGVDLGRAVPAEEAIAWAHANSVAYVESQIDLAPNALATMAERSPAIRAAHERLGIHFGLHTLSGVNIAEVSPFLSEAADEYLKAYIDIADLTGAEWVVVHAGYHFTADYEMRRKAGLERLKRACGHAEDRGVRLLLENPNREPDDAEVHYLGATIEECLYYFGNLPSPGLGWSFTVNHAHLYRQGIDGFLDALGTGRLVEVRLADCRGTVEEHLQPGDGTIDFAALFARLEGGGFTGFYMNNFGSPDDMLLGRDHLLDTAAKVGIE
jgi:sugar phosphate isomerase/epimerase